MCASLALVYILALPICLFALPILPVWSLRFSLIHELQHSGFCARENVNINKFYVFYYSLQTDHSAWRFTSTPDWFFVSQCSSFSVDLAPLPLPLIWPIVINVDADKIISDVCIWYGPSNVPNPGYPSHHLGKIGPFTSTNTASGQLRTRVRDTLRRKVGTFTPSWVEFDKTQESRNMYAASVCHIPCWGRMMNRFWIDHTRAHPLRLLS